MGGWVLEDTGLGDEPRTTPAPKQSGWIMEDTPDRSIPSPTKEPSFFGSMLQGLTDVPVAAMQGVSPHVVESGPKGLPPQYTHQPVGALINSDAGPAYSDREGNWQLVDPTKHVILRDPATNQMGVFERNPAQAEGRLTGLGRTVAPYILPSVASVAKSVPAVSRAQNALQDFENVGIEPRIPTVGQGWGSRAAQKVLGQLPGVSRPIEAGAEADIEAAQHAAQRVASRYGAAEIPEQAGEAAQRGIQQFAQGEAPLGMSAADIIASPTRASSFPAKADALYDRFWSTLDPTKQYRLDNTLDALKGPIERFTTSPELGEQITNPKLLQYYQTLAPKTTETSPVLSSLVDQFGSPMVKQAAEKITSGGTLTVPEIKEFRSFIGRAMGDPMLVNDIPRADLSNVYGALSRDLELAATDAGPAATQAFKNATNYYRAGHARIDELEKILSGSPEQAFAKINRAAGETGAADAGFLRSLQRSLQPDEWNNVSAAVIRRMGEPTARAKNQLEFSPTAFATNWNKLSDSAKDTLFGADVAGSNRESLEALNRVFRNLQGQEKLASSSTHGGGHPAGWVGLGIVAMEHAHELVEHPIAATAGVLGGYGMAKLLSAPSGARWLYQMPATLKSAPTVGQGVERAMSGLNMLVRADPSLSPIAQRFSTAFGQQEQQQP